MEERYIIKILISIGKKRIKTTISLSDKKYRYVLSSEDDYLKENSS